MALDENFEILLNRVKAGEKLPKQAVEKVRVRLEQRDFSGDVDPYTLIRLLGLCGNPTDSALVADFTQYGDPESDDDGMVRRIALQTLGRRFTNKEHFWHVVKAVESDPSPYVRMAALTMLGHFGSVYPELSRSAAKLLLDNIRSEDEFISQSAYEGIWELMGVPTAEWPDDEEIAENPRTLAFVAELQNAISEQGSADS